MAGLHTSQEMWPCVHLERWTLETVSFLCTRSVPPPCVPLAHYQQCNSMFKGPSCLVVHIQSCRLKQIAICMPLGEKKQREAPFFIPSLHLAEYFLFEAPNVCYPPPPAVTVKASQSQSNHSNQCFPVPSRLGSSCQNKRVGVQSLRWCVILWC